MPTHLNQEKGISPRDKSALCPCSALNLFFVMHDVSAALYCSFVFPVRMAPYSISHICFLICQPELSEDSAFHEQPAGFSAASKLVLLIYLEFSGG